MLELIRKSFLLQHWEFLVLVVAIGYFIVRLGRNGNKNLTKQKSDEKVIADDYKSEDDHDESESDLTPSLEDVKMVPYGGVSVTLPGGADEFFAMVNDRRSIRKYSNKTVDIEVIKKCIHAAGTSPSGAHTEPWTYCIVKRLNSFGN